MLLIEPCKVQPSRSSQSFAQLREEGAKERIVRTGSNVATLDRLDAGYDLTTPLLNGVLLRLGHWQIKSLGSSKEQRCVFVGYAFAACY